MKKRIYLSMLALLLLCSAALSSALCLIFYDASQRQEAAAIREKAALIAALLNRGSGERSIGAQRDGASPYNNPFADFINDERDTARVAIIAPDGTVLLDNKSQASALENHSGRDEFIQARDTGRGQSTRYSVTLHTMTYYYAIMLDDGNVLRVSKTLSSMIGVFSAALPAVIAVTTLILLLAGIIANKLTNSIIKPINSLDLDGLGDTVAYDELSPFFGRIERQRAQIQQQRAVLDERARVLGVIMDNMKEGLILVDKDGLILSANRSALSIFDAGDAVGKSFLFVCRDMNLLYKLRRCLLGESGETPMERGGAAYSVYFNPVYESDAVSGAILLFLDVTEQHRAERQRREFSANVSHELKTPLTTISALSEMISGGIAKPEDVRGFAAKISQQAQRLLSIISDIIRLSEFDEGTLRAAYTRFDLHELALSVAASLHDKSVEKGVTVRTEGERLMVNANRPMLDQLLFNLIDNAVKYNKDGGAVTVTLSQAGEYAVITVADTGIGIAKEHHDRIFERFYRVDKSRSKKTGGTGLGLSIVKHVVEYHDGTIEMSSEEGAGTGITVRLSILH